MMKEKIVIKLGGSSLQDPNTLQELSQLVAGYQKKYDVILVHGGGPAINQELLKRGIVWKFINGQRQTTPEMIDIIEQVLGTEVNNRIVKSLRADDIGAVGFSGAKDEILFCKASDPELMQVGEVTRVDLSKIQAAFQQGSDLVPVIAPIGVGSKGEKYNINADWAATQVAIATGAKKLIFLTDQNGILGEKQRLLKVASPVVIQKLIDSGVISGGMRTKVLAMITALEAGVKNVHVLNANSASQVLSQNNLGTVLRILRPTKAKDLIHERAS